MCWQWHWPSALIACGLALAGCDGGTAPAESSNLRSLATVYAQYMARHGGAVPRDEQEFKAFIQSLRAPSASGSTNLDAVFVSNRDGRPFVVRYRGVKDWPFDQGIIAYEQDGSGGTRFVATDVGAVLKLTDQEFQDRMVQ